MKRIRRARAGHRAQPHRAAPLKTAGGCSLFGGLDEEQWGVFMEVLEDGLAQTLAEGHWKQAAASGKAGASGVSCPRF